MADAKVSDLTGLAAASVDVDNDLLNIIDTSAGADGSKKITVQDLADVVIQTADSFTQSGTGASSRTAQAKLRERVTPEDFGAAGDGTTDDTTSLANALASGAYRLDGAPGATYLISQRLAIGSSNMWLAGNGAILKLKTAQYRHSLTVRCCTPIKRPTW